MAEPGNNGCPHGPCKAVQRVHSAVFGNGHPEESLIVRVCNVEKQLRAIKRLSWATLCGVGALLLKLVGAWLELKLRGS